MKKTTAYTHSQYIPKHAHPIQDVVDTFHLRQRHTHTLSQLNSMLQQIAIRSSPKRRPRAAKSSQPSTATGCQSHISTFADSSSSASFPPCDDVHNISCSVKPPWTNAESEYLLTVPLDIRIASRGCADSALSSHVPSALVAPPSADGNGVRLDSAYVLMRFRTSARIFATVSLCLARPSTEKSPPASALLITI